MLEPILEFKDDEELQKSLKEWQHRLFLDDWIIKAKLVDKQELYVDEVQLVGRNEFQVVNKAGCIKIAIPDEDLKDCIVKYCAESTLVHELLHCKYNWLESDYGSMPNSYYDTLEHALIEQMAKSLIMTKYNLDFDWFKNFGKSTL